MRKLSMHPLAEIIPPRRGAESQRLKEEIEVNGARDPVWIHEGRILHGYEIYQTCTESGVKPKILKYNGNHPEDFVLRVNLDQRHFSPSQRAMIAAKQATTKWGGTRIKAQNCNLSRARLAEKCKVSKRLVDTAAGLLNSVEAGEVIRELPELVWLGVIRLSRAEKIAKLPLEEQRKIIRQPRGPTRANGPSSPPERWQRGFEAMIPRPARLTEQLSRFLKDADRAEMLIPEPSRNLINECRNAGEALIRIAKWLSFKSGVGNAKLATFAEAGNSGQA
jgi:hypothetical protein